MANERGGDHAWAIGAEATCRATDGSAGERGSTACRRRAAGWRTGRRAVLHDRDQAAIHARRDPADRTRKTRRRQLETHGTVGVSAIKCGRKPEFDDKDRKIALLEKQLRAAEKELAIRQALIEFRNKVSDTMMRGQCAALPMSIGDAVPRMLAEQHATMKSSTFFPSLRAVCATVMTRSANRSPRSLWLPNERRRQSTKARNSRSAWLLVGSTPARVTKDHSASRCARMFAHEPDSRVMSAAPRVRARPRTAVEAVSSTSRTRRGRVAHL